MKEEGTSQYVEIENFYSAEGKSREMAGLRKLVTSFAGQPGIIGLHGGLPPASSFPIKSMSLTLGDGRTLVIDDPAKVPLPRVHVRAVSELHCSLPLLC